MTAFVILAAGRGTRIGRVGETLHKALVPLGQKAVISHLLELAPPDARVIVAVGHREQQVRAYLTLAHPTADIEFVYVDGWSDPGGGPGWSLLACRDSIGDDDLVFTSCDTLWTRDDGMWEESQSWAAVAPVPAGTPPMRWCRLATDSYGSVTEVIDKRHGPDGPAYVGLAYIGCSDLPLFWEGVLAGNLVAGETQVSGGLAILADRDRLRAQHVRWTDVGDEAAYRRAVAKYTGYDWTKLGEATYVLPDEGRVVKFWADEDERERRQERAQMLAGAVPEFVQSLDGMLAYRYVQGESAYKTAEYDILLPTRILNWATETMWREVSVHEDIVFQACMHFYRDKTLERIAMLPPDLRMQCEDVVSRIDWDELARLGEPVTWHGDFNFGNIVTVPGGFVGIDWRGDFDGNLWGDRRYDIAKLLAGCLVHWDNARRGDFRPWPLGEDHAGVIRKWMGDRKDIEIIAALHLLNSAPLHAAPLDEVLVSRGVTWLEEMTG